MRGNQGKSVERKTVTTPPIEASAFQDAPDIEVSGNVDSHDTASGHTVTQQSGRWWREERVKVNPARHGERKN